MKFFHQRVQLYNWMFGTLGTNREQPISTVRESQDTLDGTQRSVSPVRFSREGPLIRSLSDREQSFSSNTEDRDQLLITLSSAGGESLEDVWRMLDRPTPSPFTTPRYSGKSGIQPCEIPTPLNLRIVSRFLRCNLHFSIQICLWINVFLMCC